MRFYEIWFPTKKDSEAPDYTTNARRLCNLPPGTRVFHVITDRDGGTIDYHEYPVEDGKVVFNGNKTTPRMNP